MHLQALVLAIHNLKISEEHRTCSIDAPEPLLVFALSSGMYSSPAVSYGDLLFVTLAFIINLDGSTVL